MRRLAAPPAREITDREEDHDDNDDPQDKAEDAPPFDDTRSFRPFWAFAREIPKSGPLCELRLFSDRKHDLRYDNAERAKEMLRRWGLTPNWILGGEG